MIKPLEISALNATSAGGAMLPRQIRAPFIAGLLLVGFGTSTTTAPNLEIIPRTIQQTATGASALKAKPVANAVSELRRLSGLTWDQLGRLFNVTRRAVHFWASGGRMSPTNEERLQRILGLMRTVDRGSANENRALLLSILDDGSLPFDRLAAGDYARVLELLGPSEVRRTSPLPQSPEMLAARAPLSPEALVGALPDRIHRDRGKIRVAKSVRVGSVDRA